MTVSGQVRPSSSLIAFSFCVILLSALVPAAEAILQTAAVDVSLRDGTSYTFLASHAYFGTYPAEGASNNEACRLMLPPEENTLLCTNVTASTGRTSWTGSTILVPRGTCTFELKAWNAQKLGAAGILVHGSLASRYALNETKYNNQTNPDYTVDDIVYPQQFSDYECNNGRAEIPASSIQMEPLPYNADVNDPVLSGSSTSNLCRENSPDKLEQCESQSCLLTGKTLNSDTMLEACCAWDMHILLYNDPKFDPKQVTIQAAYLTTQQGSQLLKDLRGGSAQVYVNLYARPRPSYNVSSVLIWMLGVFVAALAAYCSADDYHRLIRRAIRRHERRANQRALSSPGSYSDDPDGRKSSGSSIARTSSSSSSPSPGPRSSTHQQQPPPQEETQTVQLETEPRHNDPPPVIMGDESLELNMWHSLAFVIMASSGLFILFFFKIYNAVKVFYAFGCSKAISQVIFYPLCWRIARRVNFRDRIVWRTNTEDFGDISVLDIISHVCGYTLGLAWLIVCFTQRHPEENVFFWVMQDVMGACMCITFLAVIKLNSLKVAALLLIVAFFYDIFFVFVTPLLFKGKSIMITVATSGGPPEADPAWCEKYPDDKNCQGGDPLPMLFTIPRIGDYQGGSSLLGLGDIVLPGLLLSFAARLDAAKSFLGLVGGGNGALNSSYSCPEQKYCGLLRFLCSGGYFIPSVVSYAIGLMMANMAVYLMEMGQPALLYLVPCCVGTMSFMAWRRNELSSLWEGPRPIRTVDAMLYGEPQGPVATQNNQHAPLPVEEGHDLEPVPSAEDGDVPLIAVPDDRNQNGV